MDTKANNWTLGEIVTLKREEKELKKNGMKSYSYFIGSRYICIREATDDQRGILMKVLGKVDCDRIKTVNGEPFSKDNRAELFMSDQYFSYPFPTANNVMEALNILRDNHDLLHLLEKASMHVNPNSTFWVWETTRNMLFQKKPMFLNSRDGQLYPSNGDDNHYRLTFVYFYKGELIW